MMSRTICTCAAPGRRNFLSGLAAAGAASVLGTSAAQTPVRRIDIHHHLLPPSYIKAVAAMRVGGRAPAWTAQMSIADMDKNGIATAVVSLVQPGVWFGDAPRSRALAREANEYAARMQQDYPHRFGSFAQLSLPDTEGSLREIEYALDVLKADGIGLMTSYRDKWLGDPSFWPVMEELNRRKAVVYTHPVGADCCKNLRYEVPPSTVEFATDTTRTMASILFSGTAARFPNIRWIFSHGGGTTPFLLSRFERVEAGLKDRGQRLPKGLMYELRKFYYDTAQANHHGALAALTTIVPTSQLLFGTDFPFRPGAEEVAGLTAYPFKPDALRAIEHSNAAQLLPRLAA